MPTRIRDFLDAIHGSKWARIIPLCLMGVLYVISMILWHPSDVADWFKPIFLNGVTVGGVYFVSRFSTGSERFKDIGNLFFTCCFVLGTVMILTGSPSVFQEGFNPGLGVGPAAFLGISLYHRYRMKKDI